MADYRWRDDDRGRWDEDRPRHGRSGYGGDWFNRDRYRRDDDRREGWLGDRSRHGSEDRSGYGYGYGPDYGERRYGRDYDFDRDRDRDRGRDYGYGYGAGRFGGGDFERSDRGMSRTAYERGRGEYEGGYGRQGYGQRDDERSWWDRTRDEVRSWMGDEDAERRRRTDEMRSGHYGRGPKGYTRSDERIREDVSDRLADDWRLDASDIEVAVSNGEVTLSGTVDSREAKRRAEDLADNVSGVRHVQNNLRIRQAAGTIPGSSGTGTAASAGTEATGTGTGGPSAGTGTGARRGRH